VQSLEAIARRVIEAMLDVMETHAADARITAKSCGTICNVFANCT
jgi:hypothetical protein